MILSGKIVKFDILSEKIPSESPRLSGKGVAERTKVSGKSLAENIFSREFLGENSPRDITVSEKTVPETQSHQNQIQKLF